MQSFFHYLRNNSSYKKRNKIESHMDDDKSRLQTRFTVTSLDDLLWCIIGETFFLLLLKEERLKKLNVVLNAILSDSIRFHY